MKKLIALTLALSMTLGLGVTAFATTEVTATPGTADTEITKTVESEFSVLIPKTIEMAGDEQDFTVQAKGNIAPTVELEVTVTGAVDMAREGDDAYEGTATVTLTDCVWDFETLTDAYTNKDGSVSFDEAKAGVYTGTETFTITLD